MEEYEQVQAKDKADGKDFNRLAQQDMLIARHHFSYLRKTKKQYDAEMKRQELAEERQKAQSSF